MKGEGALVKSRIGEGAAAGREGTVRLGCDVVVTHEITITPVDQRVVRREVLRQSWQLLLISVLMFATVAGLWVVQALELVPGPAWVPLSVACAVAVVPIATVRLARREVALLLPLGSRHVLTVSADTLGVAGPGGSSQHLWPMLSGLTRRRGVVTMRLVPTDVLVVLPGRLVTAAAFLAIAERVRVTHADGQRPEPAVEAPAMRAGRNQQHGYDG